MSAAAESEKKEGDSSGAGKPEGGGKLVLILTGVNLLVTVGVIAILILSFQRDKKKPAVEDISAHGEHAAASGGGGGGHGGGHGESKEGEGKSSSRKRNGDAGKMVTLDQFTINLATPGSVTPKFVRVNISLEVMNEDAEAEVTSKMPQIRNAIIDLFNSKKPADLATVDGRDYLKEEIKNTLNSFLVMGKVKGIFFTNFALSS
jgi:flagellar FliL protein